MRLYPFAFVQNHQFDIVAHPRKSDTAAPKNDACGSDPIIHAYSSEFRLLQESCVSH